MKRSPFLCLALAGCSFLGGARPAWQEAYDLALDPKPADRATLEGLLSHPEPLCRNFAAWGLGKLDPETSTEIALQELANDPDDGVLSRVCLTLGKSKSPRSALWLSQKLRHPSFHVRRAALEALGNLPGPTDPFTLLGQSFRDASVTVRAEAALTCAKFGGEAALAKIRDLARDPSFLIRAKVAEGAGFLDPRHAESLLAALCSDSDVRVASAAAASLKKFKAPWSLDLALRCLQRKDLSLRGEAADSIAEIGDASTLPALTAAYEDSAGHEFDEAREKIAAAAEKISGKKTLPYEPPANLPLPPAGSIRIPDRPRVEVQTGRGRVVIELYPDEAPLHVASFLELAKRGHYDGTIFHRVVTNWVVQGGDHRGDGWGATSAWGGYLPDEIGSRPFRRGSVGMPKGARRDTGGCQIFVALLPTPRLDGRYTLFGQVVEGLEILDRLEIGDRILSVRRL